MPYTLPSFPEGVNANQEPTDEQPNDRDDHIRSESTDRVNWTRQYGHIPQFQISN
jgi:hypothetical protein